MNEGEGGMGKRQLNRLLAARVKEPSAGFEERLDRLIEGSADQRPGMIGFPVLVAWAGGFAAAAVLVFGLFLGGVFTDWGRVAGSSGPSYEELFVLEEGVGKAVPLMDPMILDAILNMPVGAET